MNPELNTEIRKLIAVIIANVYNPKGFVAAISENRGDALLTIENALATREVQEGFVRLAAAGRLDLSIESVVLFSRFSGLFSDDAKAAATRRLRGSGITKSWVK